MNICSVWLIAIVAGPILQQNHKNGADIISRMGKLSDILSSSNKTKDTFI